MARDKRLTKEDIREDKFIESLSEIYAFLRENLQTIGIILGVILIAGAGYAAYYQHQENRRTEASIALRQATETYKTAEESRFDTEKLTESEESLKTAQAQLQEVFEKYPNTVFSDKARYQYAKTLYYQQNYQEARSQFQHIRDQHQTENQIYSLYAQKAIGNTYEQEGNYEKAIEAYQAKAFPPTPQLSPEIRKFVITNAKFNQALAYEKSGDPDAAAAAYKEIVDEFRNTLEAGLAQKSRELIEYAKTVIAAIGETLDISRAQTLENQKQYYEAYVAYTDAIRTYKVNKDISGGLASELRKQIGSFEKEAIEITNNVREARLNDEEGRESFALNSYGLVVEFEKLGLSRRLYENALLHHKRLESVQ